MSYAEEASLHPVASHSHQQKYLFALSSLSEVTELIRLEAAESEIRRLPEITAAWATVQPDVAALLKNEAGISETVRVEDLPPKELAKANAIIDDDLLRRGFTLRTVVALVEVDKLVAAQRRVNLDYAERISVALPERITSDFLLSYCLSPKRDVVPVQHLQLGRDTHVFSSPNPDLRFLGSFLKTLDPADLAHAGRGGIPAAALITFVGYGASPVKVIWSGSRAVLANGFHRVHALRQRGVREIPVLLEIAANASLEFPSRLIDLPREYLLGHPRPALVKDFFDQKLNTVIRFKNRLNTITVRSTGQQKDVPY